MQSEKEIKKIVKEKYGKIAQQSNKTSCCCSKEKVVEYSIMSDEYSNHNGYVAEADLNLGCGIPIDYAGIKQGDVVVDLGAGAGNDVFVARAIVGEAGKLIGIDMTPEMIDKANRNKEKFGFTNVEFKLGEIEELPLNNSTADVVVSNCVLNLVPDKNKAFSEIYRILKPTGHFCISDIVLKGELPPNIKVSAAMYAGCIAGALQEEEYLAIIAKTGFKNVEIKTKKVINLPEELLIQFLSKDDIKSLKENGNGIFSITVVGNK